MSRDFYIPGPCMVYVKGRSTSAISTLSELGLTEDQIQVSPTIKHMDVMVNAWGGKEIPAEQQTFLADVNVVMRLVHFDTAVLQECIRLSMGGPNQAGAVAMAGTRMGAGAMRFAPLNNYIGLNITSPVVNDPWRFYYAYIVGAPSFPLGTERQVATINWRVIPYTNDPWGGGTANPGTAAGTGAQNALLWDRTLDT